MLFLHVFTGFDTTSSFYNKEKRKFDKQIDEQEHLQYVVELFKLSNQSAEAIYHTGVKCFISL